MPLGDDGSGRLPQKPGHRHRWSRLAWGALFLLVLLATRFMGGVVLFELEVLCWLALAIVACTVLLPSLPGRRPSGSVSATGVHPGELALVLGSLLLLLAYMGLGGPGARGYLLLVLLWSAYVLGRTLAATPKGRSAVVFLLALVAGGQAIWGLLQSAGWSDSPALSGISGGLRNPNHYATLISLTMPFAVLLVSGGGHDGAGQKRGSPGLSVLAWGVIALWLLVLAASGSRGGVLALAGGLASVWWAVRGFPGCLALWRRQGPARLGSGLALASAPGLLILAFGWRPVGEIFGLVRRLLLYGDILSMIADHPWTGVGLGLFPWRFRVYQVFDLQDRYDSAHNEPLEWAAELGIPLALVMIGWIAYRWRGVARQARAGEPGGRRLALACCLAIATSAIHGLIDFGLRIPLTTMVFGLVLALAASVGDGASPPRAADVWQRARRRRALVVLTLLVLLVTGWRLGRQCQALAAADARSSVSLRAALEWDRDVAAIHYFLGMQLRHDPQERNIRLARDHLVRAVELNPWSWRYHAGLGQFYEELGFAKEAEASFLGALSVAPHSPRGQLLLASFYARQEAWSRAMAFGWRAVAGDPRLLEPMATDWLEAGFDPAWLVRGCPPRLADELLGVILDPTFVSLPRPELDPALPVGLFDHWIEHEPSPDPADVEVYLRDLVNRQEAIELERAWERLLVVRWGSDDPGIFARSKGERLWNGDFERPWMGGTMGWLVPTGSGAPRRVEGAGPDGSTALEISAATEGAPVGRLRQLVIVSPAEPLRLEYTYRGVGGAGAECRLQLFDPFARRKVWDEAPRSSPSDWQTVSAELVVPDGVELLLVRSGRARADDAIGAEATDGMGRCWIDRVSLRPTSLLEGGAIGD